MERLTEKFKDRRNILRKGISDIFYIGFGRFFEGEAIDRLAEYEDLEERNRLLKLPCAVGDKVFIIVGKDISKQTVKKIIIREDSVIIEANKRIFNKICFGKTVFLTREEAEAALEELLEAKNSYSQVKVLKSFANE